MTRSGFGLAAIILILDQATKHWVVEHFRQPGNWETPFFTPERVEILPFFDLMMTWNRGVSFGIFNTDGRWNAYLLSGLSLIIVAALVAWMRTQRSPHLVLALGAIIGGALGNVVDRLRWGAVADFLDVHVAGWHWPAFNLADSAITVGAVVLVLDSLFVRRTSSKT